MAEYSYIHIALRGPSEGATRTLYTYPADAPDTPSWDSIMVEPGVAVKRFLNTSECYVLQSAAEGHYLSLITRDALDADKWVMISVLVSNGASLSGRQALRLFESLRRALVDNADLSEEAAEAALAEAQVPEMPVELPSWIVPESTEPDSEAGYRTYMSTAELEQIFAFPSQPDYSHFRCVLVVPATASLRPGVKMTRITVPIRRQYSVECPEGVEVSALQVYDGDKLTITYTKEGFDSHSETITVGQPCAYAKADGAKLTIRTATQTGVRFVRRVPVRVVSSKGNDLRGGYTITLGGRLINTMVPYIDFTPRDLPEGEDVEIRVESNNYKPLKLIIPSSEVLTAGELLLELQPVEQMVTLKLDFGNGRVFTQEINIEKNTPEYNRLHSGNFHGFRAHRQVTTDNSEVYNVDVRLSNPPVAPNFDTGRDKHTATSDGETRRRSPQFENISDEAADEKPIVDTTLPTRDEDDYTSTGKEELYDDETPAVMPLWKRKEAKWGLCAVAAIAVVLTAVFSLRNKPAEATPAEVAGQGIETVSQPGETESQPQATAPDADTRADIDYLNTNAVWQLAKLRSPMGKALAEALKAGDLKAIAENDYFAVEGRCTNRDANQIVEMTWAAIGSPNAAGNARRVREAAAKEEITLHKLMEALAKVRPSENINNSPRPKK